MKRLKRAMLKDKDGTVYIIQTVLTKKDFKVDVTHITGNRTALKDIGCIGFTTSLDLEEFLDKFVVGNTHDEFEVLKPIKGIYVIKSGNYTIVTNKSDKMVRYKTVGKGTTVNIEIDDGLRHKYTIKERRAWIKAYIVTGASYAFDIQQGIESKTCYFKGFKANYKVLDIDQGGF